jgi:mannose-6-phosphate isomerase
LGAHRLATRHVERIWGRRDLAGPFAPPAGDAAEPIGEIWFEDDRGNGPGAELLVKYLFTAERLSIQVHPGDAAARAAGHARGKDEAWYVLSAEPGAVIGLGLTHQVSREALRAAALDGSIERLLDWRPAKAGDVYYSPAGTIHAIGGGLSLIEIQQNLDLTYRLYDYGRSRELHLEAGVAVADPAPWVQPFAPVRDGPRTLLAAGRAFVLERWSMEGDAAANLPQASLLIPLAPGGTIDSEAAEAGTVWAAEGRVALGGPLDLLVAYPGREAAASVLG